MEAAGNRFDRTTQLWVKATGRKIRFKDHPWIDPICGDVDRIGTDFFDRLAVKEGLTVDESTEPRGLVDDFGDLAGPTFDPSRLSRGVVDFYERTSQYDFDVWSEWCGLFRPLGALLSRVFSARLQQLNVPLSPLETRLGTTSRVLKLRSPDGTVKRTAWIRELLSTRNTLYAGSYGICAAPLQPGPCIRVVFPLPNGNAHVILQPEVGEDGSLAVVSAGSGFGDSGFYFIVLGRDGYGWVKYVSTMRESIRVYIDEDGVTRADHTMLIFGQVFLRLHYRLGTRQLAA